LLPDLLRHRLALGFLDAAPLPEPLADRLGDSFDRRQALATQRAHLPHDPTDRLLDALSHARCCGDALRLRLAFGRTLTFRSVATKRVRS
jgi:hypothetical protein